MYCGTDHLASFQKVIIIKLVLISKINKQLNYCSVLQDQFWFYLVVIRHLVYLLNVFSFTLILYLWAVVTCCSQRANSYGWGKTSNRYWQVYWISSALRYFVAVRRCTRLISYPALNSVPKLRNNIFSIPAVIYNKLHFTTLKYFVKHRHSNNLNLTNKG